MLRAIVCALALAQIGAQAAAAELLPTDREITDLAPYPHLHAYQLAVRDALLGRSARHTCEAMVMPSFEREWAVYLQETAGGGREVVLTEMESQLWGSMHAAAEQPEHTIRPGDIPAALRRVPKGVRRSSAPLSAAAAALVEQACSALLARAELPAQPRRCLDGVSYYIFQWRADPGDRGGLARCPAPDSPPFRMLDLLEDLRSAAGSAGGELMQRDMAVARKATQLLLSLEPPGGRATR